MSFLTYSSIAILSYCPIGDATHNLSLGVGKRNFGVSSLFPGNNNKFSEMLISFSLYSERREICDLFFIFMGRNKRRA